VRPGAPLLLPWLLQRLAAHPGWQHLAGRLLLLLLVWARQAPLCPALLALLRLCQGPGVCLPAAPAAQTLVPHSRHVATTLLAHALQQQDVTSAAIRRRVGGVHSLLAAAQAACAGFIPASVAVSAA
jgi:hypothetical protein